MKQGEKMKIKPGFKLKRENGETYIVCDKSINPSFNSTIILTESSEYLWKMIQDGTVNKEQLLNGLLDKFEISAVLALSNIDIFIKTLKENGILE